MRAQFPAYGPAPSWAHTQKMHSSESKQSCRQHLHDLVPGTTSAFSRAWKLTFSDWQLYSRVSSVRMQPGSEVGSGDDSPVGSGLASAAGSAPGSVEGSSLGSTLGSALGSVEGSALGSV